MQKTKSIPFLLLIVFALFSCRTSYQPGGLQYNSYKVSQTKKEDDKLATLLKPYSDSIGKSMMDVIAIAGSELKKGQPEGSLGNLLADIMLSAASRIYKTKIDASVLNEGGIRVSSIPAGSITRWKVFEVMPFDNIIVLQKLTGKQLQAFLDYTALRRGWPVSGLTMQIKDKKAFAVKINDAPLDLNGMYTIALPDYVAGGGDGAEMLRNIPQQNSGYIFRDEIIAYLSAINSKGEKIAAKIENRVTNAE
jgi:2',3'-cyclic-nucleotide 2'-phosphodiesterase (5'-nucleotidase family)